MLRRIAAPRARGWLPSLQVLRCVSKHEGAEIVAVLILETRVPSLESAVLVVLRVPQDEDEHSRQTPYSLFTQPSSFPRRVFAPGFCFLASRTRKEGWRSAERRSGA